MSSGKDSCRHGKIFLIVRRAGLLSHNAEQPDGGKMKNERKKKTISEKSVPLKTKTAIKNIVSDNKVRAKLRPDPVGGMAVLFAGPSGSGKTLAAKILAKELGMDLYRVDLAGVISKYIGETEKNLKKVFERAEKSNSLLFFDEADAIFGKRQEVKDSHDRYANIEISYLLQRIENYRGMAVLTTNNKENYDPAFLRRFRYIVEFNTPDDGEDDSSGKK